MKKLVQKLVARDTLNYRKLTDTPVTKDGEKVEKDESTQDGEENSQLPDDSILALGKIRILV